MRRKEHNFKQGWGGGVCTILYVKCARGEGGAEKVSSVESFSFQPPGSATPERKNKQYQ